MKNALKGENDKFSAMTLKLISGVTFLINHRRTPNLWAIAHESGSKT